MTAAALPQPRQRTQQLRQQPQEGERGAANATSKDIAVGVRVTKPEISGYWAVGFVGLRGWHAALLEELVGRSGGQESLGKHETSLAEG